MNLHHEKSIKLVAQELIARLSSETSVGEFLAISMDGLAKLRFAVDEREPSNEQIALLQGAAVGIAVVWGNARLSPNKKHTIRIVEARVEAFCAELLALEALFASLPPAPEAPPEDVNAAAPANG